MVFVNECVGNSETFPVKLSHSDKSLKNSRYVQGQYTYILHPDTGLIITTIYTAACIVELLLDKCYMHKMISYHVVVHALKIVCLHDLLLRLSSNKLRR